VVEHVVQYDSTRKILPVRAGQIFSVNFITAGNRFLKNISKIQPQVMKVNLIKLFSSVAWSSSARVVRWMVNCYERA